MRKPLNFNIRYRVFVIWIAINTMIGIVFTFFLSVGIKEPFINILLICQFGTHIISLITLSAAYALGYITHNRPLLLTLCINNIGVAIASLLGIKLGIYFTRLFFDPIHGQKISEIFNEVIIPVIIFTVTANTVGIFIERFRHNRLSLIKDLLELKKEISGIQSLPDTSPELSFIEKEIYYKIKYDDIIYFASHGKISTIHTTNGDYSISRLLKELDETIPQELFLRIHKQFIVNLKYIHRKQYYKGGRYIIHLKDEEDSMLPVGSSYTAILNEKLKI